MREAKTVKAAAYLQNTGAKRLWIAQRVRWPALEDSFRRELEDAQRIARERGLL